RSYGEQGSQIEIVAMTTRPPQKPALSSAYVPMASLKAVSNGRIPWQPSRNGPPYAHSAAALAQPWGWAQRRAYKSNGATGRTSFTSTCMQGWWSVLAPQARSGQKWTLEPLWPWSGAFTTPCWKWIFERLKRLSTV